ncbi:MAG: TetR/AcrR family transcriptional regulator [Clostridia bacterium]|nr:TetR/AcrR family transcriptional regulator [Clostridia bacterium]
MPPKSRYTKEQIIKTAAELVREEGIEVLTARALAKKLGCTTQPIFSCYENMDQLLDELHGYINNLYGDYIKEGLKGPIPFKGAGLQFIRFAMEEPHYFQFLFMQDQSVVEKRFMPANDENAPQILTVLQENHHLSLEAARALYNHISVYTYGLAITFLGKNRIFTIEDADRMLGEIFWAIIKETQHD